MFNRLVVPCITLMAVLTSLACSGLGPASQGRISSVARATITPQGASVLPALAPYIGDWSGYGRQLTIMSKADGFRGQQAIVLGWCGRTSCKEVEELILSIDSSGMVTARVSEVKLSTVNGTFLPVGYAPVEYAAVGDVVSLTARGAVLEELWAKNGDRFSLCRYSSVSACGT